VTTLRALLYADVRTSINLLKEIRRSPARAIMWALFTLFVAAFIVLRVVRAVRRESLPMDLFPAAYTTDAMVCAGFILFGVAVAFGSRMAGLFAHPAEARFIIGSPATPFVATLYVQARDVLRGGGRRGLGLLYIALFYLPDRLDARTLAGDIVLIVVAFTAIGAVPLARQLLAKPAVPFALAAGWVVIAIGVLALVRDAAVAFRPPAPLGPAALLIPDYHPGAILLAPASAQIATIGALLACTAALFTFVARAARDAYPELYEFSMNRIQRAERLRGRFFTSGAAAVRTPVRSAVPVRGTATAGAPPGALIFVWRAWTEYRRTHDPRSTGLETALFLGAGYAVSRLTAAADPDILLAVASPAITLLFFLALMKSATLGNELRRPIFWLSATTLFERLCALALAQAWRIIGWFVLFAIGLAAGRSPLLPIVLTVAGGPAAVLLAIAVGYASYALFPSEVDQRGPLFFVRFFLGYALLSPAIVAGIVTGVLVRAPVVAIGVATATALLEAAVLIGFAAWRLDRMSISLTTLPRS
jgi:hypothetical protein